MRVVPFCRKNKANIMKNKFNFLVIVSFVADIINNIVNRVIIMDIQMYVSKGCNKLSKCVVMGIGEVNVIYSL